MSELTHEGIVAALETEQRALEALAGRVDDEQWLLARADGWTVHDIVAHVGDSAFGLGVIALRASQVPPGGAPPDRDAIMATINRRNDERRVKLAALSRAEIEGRIATGFSQAIKATGQVADLQSPSGGGPAATVGGLLMRAAQHSSEHRQEIEDLLKG
ncbi:MAG: DinB family protein [Chloroflexales bacterium]|nr:DinB family protein [Chloroflexales bacterium]